MTHAIALYIRLYLNLHIKLIYLYSVFYDTYFKAS